MTGGPAQPAREQGTTYQKSALSVEAMAGCRRAAFDPLPSSKTGGPSVSSISQPFVLHHLHG